MNRRKFRRLGGQVVSWFATWTEVDQGWVSFGSEAYEVYDPDVHGIRAEGETWTQFYQTW